MSGQGRRLERAWEQSHQAQTREREESRQKILRESEQEIETFTRDMAQDLFRKDVKSLADVEKARIDRIGQGRNVPGQPRGDRAAQDIGNLSDIRDLTALLVPAGE